MRYYTGKKENLVLVLFQYKNISEKLVPKFTLHFTLQRVILSDSPTFHVFLTPALPETVIPINAIVSRRKINEKVMGIYTVFSSLFEYLYNTVYVVNGRSTLSEFTLIFFKFFIRINS